MASGSTGPAGVTPSGAGVAASSPRSISTGYSASNSDFSVGVLSKFTLSIFAGYFFFSKICFNLSYYSYCCLFRLPSFARSNSP